ncbi:hypothetical protein [Bacillus thuringiensis]|uniref:hypothetical protein n=1 Tax=Bacillus thuringiensis TaxID=1428 RepID=UPI000BF6CE6E|nr:hypothetical protein [Bacillus thuringiensis]PFV50401.1 hypothetical protein COL14_12575 [Bacillus thuringiensis]
MSSIKEERTTTRTNAGRESSTAIGNIAKRVVAFNGDFIEGLEKITTKIDEKTQLLNDKQLELRFVQEKELPEALVKKYVDDDDKEAKRLQTLETKLQKEITELQEEILVITHLKEKYEWTKANEAKALEVAFNEERNAATQRTYRRMEAAKRAYLETIKAESESLHEYHGVAWKLAKILEVGGLKKSMPWLPVSVVYTRGNHGFHGSYLEVPTQLVKDIIKGSVDEEHHIEYLPTRG